jgi:hypothetical protein
MNQDFKRQGEEKPLGQLVKGIMKAYGLEEKMKSYDLIAAWPELMGPAVAQRTKDIKIQNAVMHMSVKSSSEISGSIRCATQAAKGCQRFCNFVSNQSRICQMPFLMFQLPKMSQ